MKLAMAQMSMSEDIKLNELKTLKICHQAQNLDLLFFPEIQLSPFFKKKKKKDVEQYVTKKDAEIITLLKQVAKRNHLYISPNMYIEDNGERFDRSLFISPEGKLVGEASMVHIYQTEKFYEKDYYTPSKDGFHVFETPFGKIGIVICFDRHMPESIRACALQGADLVIVPTANCKAEPMEMFEWEMRVQAMQNSVFIAMCNRVGTEGDMEFAGESLVVDPYGKVIYKADDREKLIEVDIDLSIAAKKKKEIPWLELRREEFYGRQ